MSIKNLKVISVFALLFFVFSAEADLISEFGLSLSKKSVNKFLSQISGEFKIENEPIELGKEGILKDLNYSSSKLFLDAYLDFKFAEGASLHASAEVKSVGIKLKDFNYTEVTIIKETGINARVTTKINCTELVIELNEWDVDLSSPIKFQEGRLILDRAHGALDPRGSNVKVDLSKCVAPKGVDIVLKDLVLEWIASEEGNSVLFGAVLDYGQEFIDVEFDKLVNSLNLDILDKRIDLVFETVSFLKDKVEVIGLLTAQSEENSYTLSLNRSDFDKAKTGADVLLPKLFFSKLFPDFMKEVMVKLELKRADVPQVDFLFNSRFIQFFVWRDLLNFKKASDFSALVEVDTKNLVLMSSGSNFKYQLRGNYKIDMDFLNSRGTHYPYMDFSGQMAADLDLSFTDAGVSIGISNTNLSARADWDDEMSSWRKSRPNGKPWMSIIVPRIKDALKSTNFSYSWSDLGLGDYIQKAKLYHTDKSTLIGVSLN
jgi:hypothetical protein